MFGSPPPSLHVRICCHPPNDTVPMAKYKIQNVAMYVERFTYEMDNAGHYRSFSDSFSCCKWSVLDPIVAKNLP